MSAKADTKAMHKAEKKADAKEAKTEAAPAK
jgi:hypothetical protein